LSTVGQDANNHSYVIVYAIVDVENKDNWKSIKRHLTTVFGERVES